MDSQTLDEIVSTHLTTVSNYAINKAYVSGKNPTIIRNSTGDDPDNRLPIPLAKVAVDNMVGYMMPPGEPDIYYQLTDANEEWSAKDDEYNAQIKNWREYNDDSLVIAEMVNEAMSQGVAYEVWWTEKTDPKDDSFPVQPEWVKVPASQIYIQWTNSLKPEKEFAVRFYKDGKDDCAVVYYPGKAEGWKKDNGSWKRNADDDLVYPFEIVPVLEAKINQEGLPVYESEKQIVDQIDKVMSKSLNEVDRFNAMIALFPFVIDTDVAAELKRKGYFHGLDQYDSEKWPRYLEKNLGGAVEFYKWMVTELKQDFYTSSRIIDLTDPLFGSGDQSGRALAIKLMCMELVAAKAETYLRRWLIERKELFDACINAGTSGIDTTVYKTEIKWSRNVPVSSKEQLEIASMMMGLQMTRESILKILPKAILPDWERELNDQDRMPAPRVPAINNDVEDDQDRDSEDQ